MSTIEKDFNRTKDIINGTSFVDENYNSIYFHSNEQLKSIFDQIDVKGRKCLTVLGSGDQAFYMFDRDAKSVDMFDINKLAIYYYYLRVWTIKYLDRFYPDNCIEKDFILNLLKYVKVSNKFEKIAYDYWMRYAYGFENYKRDILERLFIVGNNPYLNNLDDLLKIKNRLNDSINFMNVDLSDENILISKKYDIIFTSNIIDYLYGLYRKSVYRHNLIDLLNDEGMIIATYVINNYRKSDEMFLFDRYFDFRELDNVYCDSDYKCPGYVYTKKKNKWGI